MTTVASQITSLTIVYSIIYSFADQKTSKLRFPGLCVGNAPGTGEFPAQMASNAENVFIWWRHHDYTFLHFAPKYFMSVFLAGKQLPRGSYVTKSSQDYTNREQGNSIALKTVRW